MQYTFSSIFNTNERRKHRMKLYKTSNENIDSFKEKMGDEWVVKQDSYFDRESENKENENKKFNIFEFVTNSLFNYF